MGLFAVLGVLASPTWWAYTPWLLPLTPLIECKILRERSLPAPRREDPDALVATLWPRQPRLLRSTNARPGQSVHHCQRRVSRPHWSPVASCSTTYCRCTPPHQPQSSGVMMSISSSSRPSIPRIMREGGRSRRQRIHAPPRLRAHRHLLTALSGACTAEHCDG
jgi:hypothetical protein